MHRTEQSLKRQSGEQSHGCFFVPNCGLAGRLNALEQAGIAPYIFYWYDTVGGVSGRKRRGY